MSDHSPTPAPQPTPATNNAAGWSAAFNCLHCKARVVEEGGTVFDYEGGKPHTCPHMAEVLTAMDDQLTARERRTAAPQEGTTPPVLIGCDPECTADGGYPALCEMYPDEKHAGCSRQRVSSSGTTTDEIEQRIAGIEARLGLATPGPWRTTTNRSRGPWHDRDCVPLASDGVPVLSRNWKEACLNAAFIAHAPDDVPWLIAELRRSRASLERVTEIAENYSAFADTDLAGTVATMDSMIREGAQNADAERLDALAEYVRANGGARLWRSKWEEGVVISVDAHSDEPQATCEEALRATLDDLRESQASLPLSQTDSSLRAAEPRAGHEIECGQRFGDGCRVMELSGYGDAHECCGPRYHDGKCKCRCTVPDSSSPTVTPPEAPTRIIESKAQATVLLYQNTGAEEANRLIERLNDPMTAKIIVTAPNDTFVHQLQLRCAQDPALLDRIDVMYVEKDGTTTRIGLDEEGERCWPPGLFHEDWRISIDLMRTRSPKVAQLMDARAARSTPTEEKTNV